MHIRKNQSCKKPVIPTFLSSVRMCIAHDECNASQTDTVFQVSAEFCTTLVQRAA